MFDLGIEVWFSYWTFDLELLIRSSDEMSNLAILIWSADRMNIRSWNRISTCISNNRFQDNNSILRSNIRFRIDSILEYWFNLQIEVSSFDAFKKNTFKDNIHYVWNFLFKFKDQTNVSFGPRHLRRT